MGKEESEGLTCQALPGNLELGFQTCSLGGSFKSSLRAGPAGAMLGKRHGFRPRRRAARLQSGPFRRHPFARWPNRSVSAGGKEPN